MIRLLRLPALVVALGCTLGLAPASAAVPGDVPVIVNWTPSGTELAAQCALEIARERAVVERIAAAPASMRTFAGTVVPLENAQAETSERLVAAEFLANVSTDPEVRKASFKCNSDLSAFYSEIAQRPDLYAALGAVKASNTASTDAERRLVDDDLNGLKRAGAGLNAADRKTFLNDSNRLTELGIAFRRNLNDDQSTIVIPQTQTAGLAADFLSTLKTNDGGYIVPVTESTLPRVLNTAKSPEIRKAFYVAYDRRAGDQNVAILKEAIGIRDHLAKLLGYPTWAAYRLSDRMAKTPERVTAFLTNLDSQLLPRAKVEIAALAALKAQDLGNSQATLDPWDFRYYETQLRKTRYAVDEEVVRQYFPVQHTVDAVLGIYQKVLGVRYTPVKPANAWAPEVLRYAVADASSGRYIGDFYLDLYPRPGKFTHFANWNLVPNRTLPGGARRAKIAAIVGNWPQAAPGSPALLTHTDVVTFFHEFGHNMAALLGAAPYASLGSYKRDFVEAPSQMLENWVWNPAILKELSANVQTGAPMPDELIAKLVAAKNLDQAVATTRQVTLAAYDMALHTSGPDVDPVALWKAAVKQYAALPYALEDSKFPGTFGHLFGYDAGYYGYQWSLVYAQDMFTAFKTGGLESPDVGMRYRKTILEPAGTYDAESEVRTFLGREMNVDAYYRELGITAAPSR